MFITDCIYATVPVTSRTVAVILRIAEVAAAMSAIAELYSSTIRYFIFFPMLSASANDPIASPSRSNIDFGF